MSALDPVIPHLKALHIGFLVVWIAGVLALPAMLARHDRAINPSDFIRIRNATHYAYVWVITPAAIVAIATGTALIFLRDVFTSWMFAKLICVAGLVALHAWVGHTIVAVAETEGQHEPAGALLPNLLTVCTVAAILIFVLAKPDLGDLPMPGWLLQPLRRDLPFDVPSP